MGRQGYTRTCKGIQGYTVVYMGIQGYTRVIIIIARHLSAHLKFSMRLQRKAKTLNHLYNLR